jgi:hypothetical protein
VSGIETADLIEPWLYSTLSRDPVLTGLLPPGNVYGALTPDEIFGVYVTFSLMSLRDVRGVGKARFSVDTIYLVKAVEQTTTQDNLVPVFRRIDALLDGAHYDGPEGSLDCIRETVISHPQVISDAGQVRGGGQSFWHLGGNFRIRAS